MKKLPFAPLPHVPALNAAVLGVLALCAAALLAAAPARAASPVIRLTMSSQYMDRHPVVVHVFKPWIEEIKKRTNGQVVINYYNPNTLCPDGELYDAVAKGQVDIGGHLASRNPGRLPVNCVINKVPMVSSNALAGAMAYWELYQATPAMQAEYAGIKILALHTTAPSHLHYKSDRAWTSLDDIRGVKIIAPTQDSVRIFKALGANPIMVPSPDVYLSLSRNMAKGTLFPLAALRSFKIDEAVNHTTYIDSIVGACWFGMNPDSFARLPEDVQTIFLESTGADMSRRIAEALDQGEAEDIAVLTQKGHAFNRLEPDEYARWRDLAAPVLRDAWLDDVKDRNLDDPEALYRKAGEFSQRSEQQYGRK